MCLGLCAVVFLGHAKDDRCNYSVIIRKLHAGGPDKIIYDLEKTVGDL